MALSADLLIKDAPSDTGAEPFPQGHPFWGSPDIVVRANDDDVFAYQPAVHGQKNFVYVRVRNLGPDMATDIDVSVRAVGFPGTEFVYPYDWTTVDATHIKPFGITPHQQKINSGASAIFKFRLEQADVDTLYGWEQHQFHPCLLAEVKSDQDSTSGFGVHVWDRNNLAQRNISVVQLSPKQQRRAQYGFVAGNPLNSDPYLELVVDRSGLPRKIELLMDPADRTVVFPALTDEVLARNGRGATRVLDRTRLAVSLCGSDGILTLEPGSAFEFTDGGCPKAIPLSGAEWVHRQGQRLLAIRGERAVIGVPRAPGELRQMSLTMEDRELARAEKPFVIQVSQRNMQGRVVGGVTVVAQ